MMRLWPIWRIHDPTPDPPPGRPAQLNHRVNRPVMFEHRYSGRPFGFKNNEIQKTNDYKGLAELVATNSFAEPSKGRRPPGVPLEMMPLPLPRSRLRQTIPLQ